MLPACQQPMGIYGPCRKTRLKNMFISFHLKIFSCKGQQQIYMKFNLKIRLLEIACTSPRQRKCIALNQRHKSTNTSFGLTSGLLQFGTGFSSIRSRAWTNVYLGPQLYTFFTSSSSLPPSAACYQPPPRDGHGPSEFQ